ncbi:hypothetical protein H6S82_14830 [Planktothrix sp. FACHB-1355]|uniref:Uncharacterized protein n=1 Tax=Aerosakkonema funiforme FACHB-1375 TaxID=2949571 RepID=A0A926VCQ5_9CYAN|nr:MULTISPECIES: hypothetical protein [Oscillatoriales]MBD2180492.1 hypothetical protein [Aerosakkonema funiforme FACHB-1375]MBD3560121.1 hypothetical protein [Planktothrix sp. FACHB-1355]
MALNIAKLNHKISVLELVKLWEDNHNSIIINLQHLRDNYQRQGLKKIPGSRDEKGNLVPPLLKGEFTDGGEYVRAIAFKLNRNTATINMLTSRPFKLVNGEDGNQITEVAGLLFTDLETFNNYTIVRDGDINVKSLQVKFSSQKVFDLFKEKGVVEKSGNPVENYDFRAEYTICFDNLPLVPEKVHYNHLNGVFDELAEVKVLASILSAFLKKESDTYIPEQVEELKKHYLSKNLYINFPKTTEYASLDSALANGTVDFRKSYKVDIGSKDILNFGKLPSANKFLDRIYEAYNRDTGEKVEKPTFDIALNANIIFAHKTLSSRTKITKVDELMQPIFDDFLGMEDNGSVAAILSKVGADNLMPMLQAKWNGEKVNRDEFVAALTAANEQLEDYVEKVYREKISPLVFYIGSTGHLPDDIDAVAQTAAEIGGKYPNLQFSKYEREGTFFEVGDTIISVYAKYEYYTVKTPA